MDVFSALFLMFVPVLFLPSHMADERHVKWIISPTQCTKDDLWLGMVIYQCHIDILIFLNIKHGTIFHFTYRYTFDISHQSSVKISYHMLRLSIARCLYLLFWPKIYFTFAPFSFTTFPFNESWPKIEKYIYFCLTSFSLCL